MFSNKKLPKICSKYFCEKCDYRTGKKSSYDDHLLTAKHNLAMFSNENSAILGSKFMCPNCCKEYKDNSGLWRHKKKCIAEQNGQATNQQSLQITTDVVLQILKQNEDLQKLLVEQTYGTSKRGKEYY